MTKQFQHKALILARESRGLTQTQLAQLTEIPQSSISRIEQDTLGVDDSTVKKLAEVLKYPESFFFQEVNIYPPNLHYRKRVTIPVRVKDMAEATMNIYRLNLQTLLQSVDLPESTLPIIEEGKYDSPADVAMYLRQFWKVPKGRIDNLTQLVESKGIIVVRCNLFTEKIDGRSMVTDKGNFIIFLNKSLSGDRLRFTLAHELAHLILHIHSNNVFNTDVEEEANIFACEFLMPQDEIRPQLYGRLTLPKLADLKRYWKTSMQAILKWSERLNVTTPNQAKYLWSQISSLGMRKKEPIEIAQEQPSLLSKIIEIFMTELQYTKDELAKLLCLSVEEYQERFTSGKVLLRAVK